MATEPEQEAGTTAEVTRRYFEAIRARDPDRLGACWAPGSIDHFYGMAEFEAPHEVRDWFRQLFAAFPDFEMVVADMIVDGERSAVRWQATGTFDGEGSFEGMIPNGKRVSIEGLDLLTVRDGAIVDNRAFTNGMEMARQLGALPRQGSAQEKAMMGAMNLRTRVAARLRRDG